MISVTGFTIHVLLTCPILWELVIISHFHKSYLGKVLLIILPVVVLFHLGLCEDWLLPGNRICIKSKDICTHASPYSIVSLIFSCCTNPSFDLILPMQLCSHESLSKGNTFLEMCPWVNQLLCEDCGESSIKCVDELSKEPLFCLWL